MNIGEILFQGEWTEDRVTAYWDPALGRATTPEIEAEIERAWAALKARQPRTFDGALIRGHRYEYSPDRIVLHCGPASYRDYVGTHAYPGATDEVRANPLSGCCAVHTADGRIVVGLRSGSVESPGKWHVIAGHAERDRHVRDGLVYPFQVMRDELWEELGVTAEQIESLVCTGMTRPPVELKPELTFYARIRVTMEQLRADHEHARLDSIAATPEAVAEFLATRDTVAAGRACLRSCIPFLQRGY